MPSLSVDGRARARVILENLAPRAAAFRAAQGRRPRLRIVRVGEDAAQDRYAAKKVAAGEQVGLDVAVVRPPLTTMSSATDLVRALGVDPDVDAVFVQYPLPEGFDERGLFDAIAIDKDVDCASTLALGRLIVGGGLAPANVAGLMDLLEANRLSLVGRRLLITTPFVSISQPLATLLVRAGAFVGVLPDADEAPDRVGALGPGDVFVSCVGRPGYMPGSLIPSGVSVIDGAYFHPKGGDIRVEDDAARFALWVPSRNALGPMTIAWLMKNAVQLAQARASMLA